ncbi:MAG: helix-turn-helix domain-containing protein, partial [Nitrospiraceae bacterium]
MTMEIAGYIEAIKQRYHLKSDYALAEKLGIAQPEANLIRRGLKVPRPELCIKIAKLLDRNPVELLLIAQKDKAPAPAKEYWTLALNAVDVMLHVPKSPRYIPRKVEAIGRELRQLESQTLTYEGAAASAE